MISPLRSDLWCAVFVRRHNDLGNVCVVVRRGDAIAGQIFVTLDHLNGEVSLFTPAPAAARQDDGADRVFQRRLDHARPDAVQERIEREVRFDPDLWVIALEMRRETQLGLTVIRA